MWHSPCHRLYSMDSMSFYNYFDRTPGAIYPATIWEPVNVWFLPIKSTIIGTFEYVKVLNIKIDSDLHGQAEKYFILTIIKVKMYR